MRVPLFLALLLVYLTAPDTAHADPISTAIAAIATAFSESALGAFLSTTLGRIVMSVALTALQYATMEKPKQAGIKTSVTASGGTNPATFILGRYATAGTAVCPAMSHGFVGDTPNAFLTYVIELGDLPGQQLAGVIIDGDYVTFETAASHYYGRPATGRLAGECWLRFYDGSQTSADPMLLEKYADYPERPWQADMIGRGICYAILTFEYSRKKYAGFPECVFVLDGIPLYDPRKDSSVGGSGSQRWATPSTWQSSVNTAVQLYNIRRGISLTYGTQSFVWGGDATAADLPLATWFAAMNEADVEIAHSGGGSAPQFRTGWEVSVDEEPAAVMEELLKGCNGQIVETGAACKIRIGGPGLPVYFFTDDDVVVTESQDYAPFPGLDRTYNGVQASYPEPANLWQQKDAPPRFDEALEASDQGRRLTASLTLNAVYSGRQVQRLMRAYIKEERRFRRHTLTLPPDAALLEPLDTVAWTSVYNGYDTKSFEISELVDDLATCLQRVSLRERDASDVVWTPDMELPWDVPSVGVVVPAAQAVPGFDANAASVKDGAGGARRPSILLTWSGTGLPDVDAVQWEIRLAGDAAATLRDSVTDVESGSKMVAEGILSLTAYDARARLVTDRDTSWTAWKRVTTGDVRLGLGDLAQYPAPDIILPGTVGLETLVVSDFSGNLIINGDMGYGDTRGWGALPSTFSLRARDAASPVGAVVAAPTLYILQLALDADDQSVDLVRLNCQPGDSFSPSFAFAASGTTRSAVIRLRTTFYDASGTYISAAVREITATATGWATYRGAAFTAPAGTVYCVVRLYRMAGGSGTGFVTNMELVKQRGAAIVVTPESITGALLVKTEELITEQAQMGSAVIGTAQIRDLAVDTLQIAGNAVSIFRKASGAGGDAGAYSWTPRWSLSFTPQSTRDLVLWYSGIAMVKAPAGKYGYLMIRTLWRGSIIDERRVLVATGSNATTSQLQLTGLQTFAPGGTSSGTLQMQARMELVDGTLVGLDGSFTDIIGIIGDISK